MRKDVESGETMSFNASCKLLRVQLANWNTTFLLARDLHLLTETDYRELNEELSTLRRMLTSLLQKIETERVMAKC